MSDHLVVNVEEQIAKRLLDQGLVDHARAAVHRAASLPNDTPLEELELGRMVPVTKEEMAQRRSDAEDAALIRFRGERDARLKASDWTQLPDIPAKTRDAWAKYRQQLRDLPDTTNDPAKPEWPESPD